MKKRPSSSGSYNPAETRSCWYPAGDEYFHPLRGGMCEWLKQAVLKTALPARVTGVRIPLPPPSSLHWRLVPRYQPRKPKIPANCGGSRERKRTGDLSAYASAMTSNPRQATPSGPPPVAVQDDGDMQSFASFRLRSRPV